MGRSPSARNATSVVGALLGVLVGASVLAQGTTAPAGSGNATHIPRPDELEPGVDTSKSTPSAAPAAAPTAGPAAAAAPAAAPAVAPRAAATTAPKGAAAAPGTKAAGKKGNDRLELDTTDVTGNSELPKVLYIVPWKRSDLGDMVGRPVNSLLDEVMQPIDRDVFRRENRYYDAVKPEGTAVKPDAAQGSGVKP